ncbi:transcriptional regulatory protein YycF [mine drainage metagenome]|jgi:DNA-binding response OmpR family regulator|uniref:Transcriptional regulatory protein YycF n=1 Tax=mine drainage metagenome TaxID=410659 RepID=A0A1J5RHR7_9ZZZZ
MDQPRRILLIEDDPDIAQMLGVHLREEGYALEHCARGDEGVRRLEDETWDALLLDVMLPGVDGLEICRRVRAMPRYTPVIIISARSGEAHRVVGLELGADDYLSKPFSVLELAARVKALLRRVDALRQRSGEQGGASLRHGALFVDPIARTATLAGRPLELTPREFDLLYFFASHPDKVFSRMALLDAVWGYNHEGYEHTVNTHINRLRSKMEANSAQPGCIVTVWGHGYKFVAPGGAA